MSDFLARLEGDRAGHERGERGASRKYCQHNDCDHAWPCPAARALDALIAGVKALRGDAPEPFMAYPEIEEIVRCAYEGKKDRG